MIVIERKIGFTKGAFVSVIIGIVVAGVFSAGFYALATPPGSPYAPGETTSPSCSPSDTNCTVTSAVPYTGATQAIDVGNKNFTTTGALSAGSLTLTTTALGVGNGGTGTGTTFTQGSVIFSGASGVYSQDNANFFWDSSTHRLGLGNASPGSTLDVKGTLRLSGSSSGFVGLQGASAAGSTTYTLPSADGTDGQLLKTNGSGVLSWTTVSGGSGMAIGSPVTSGTSGSVLVVNGSGNLAQDNANLFWDLTTHRLGLGNVSPSAPLDVFNSSTASSAPMVMVNQNTTYPSWATSSNAAAVVVRRGSTSNNILSAGNDASELFTIDGATGSIFFRGSSAGFETPFAMRGSDRRIYSVNNSNPLVLDGSGNNVRVISTSGAVPLVVRGAVSQSANLQEWQTSGGTALDSINANGDVAVASAVRTSGSPTLVTVTGPAHTTLAASTEASDIIFNLARTVQFSTGALATQRAVYIQAPTYGFVGASTITNASTLAVSGAPVQGTNATISSGYSILSEGGTVGVRFAGGTNNQEIRLSMTSTTKGQILVGDGSTGSGQGLDLKLRDRTYTFTDGAGSGFQNPSEQLQSGTFRMGSGTGLGWSSNSSPGGASNDTGFARNGAGIVEINNGSAGTYRDLRLRGIGLNVAPSGNANISVIGDANNLTLLTLKRNTDTLPTGNFVDFQNAAAASLYTLDITGKITKYGGSTPTDGQLLIGGTSNGNFTAATLTGTANQVNVANGNGSITLSLPQSIATSSGPTFANLTDSALTSGRVTLAGASGILSDSANLTWSSPALSIGAGSSATGQLKFNGTTSGTVTLTAVDAAGTWTMKLPTTAGNNGEFLKTDGSGNTSWAAGGSGSPGGSSGQVQFNSSSTFGGAAGFTYQSGASPNVTIVAQNAAYVPLLLKAAASQSGNLQEWQNSSAGVLASIGSSGTLTLGLASTNTGTIKFKNSSNSNTFTLQSGATGSDLTFTLPTADGQASDCLKTDGTGVLSFGSCGGVQPSDIKIKDSIASPKYGLADLMKLSVKSFTYRKEFVNDGDIQKTHTGLIAEDVQQVFPEAVSTYDRSKDILGIDYATMVPLLIQSIQDLARNQGVNLNTLQSGSVSGVDTKGVAGSLESLGMHVVSGVLSLKEVVADKFTAQTASIKTAQVEKFEMKDQSTGTIYCVGIVDGALVKTTGTCNGSLASAAHTSLAASNDAVMGVVNVVQQAQQAAQQIQQATQQAQQTAQNIQQTAANAQQAVQDSANQATQNVVQQATDQVVSHVQDQIQQDVQQQVQQVQEQSSAPQEPKTLFDIFTSPAISKEGNINILQLSVIGLIMCLIGILFVMYRIDRRKLLKRISEVQQIKEVPHGQSFNNNLQGSL